MLYALTPYRKTAMVLGVLVIIMSIARVMALVHTPLDVTGGMILGLTGAVWYRYVAKA
jgi:membrane-associated phospholipid phosphatase